MGAWIFGFWPLIFLSLPSAPSYNPPRTPPGCHQSAPSARELQKRAIACTSKSKEQRAELVEVSVKVQRAKRKEERPAPSQQSASAAQFAEPPSEPPFSEFFAVVSYVVAPSGCSLCWSGSCRRFISIWHMRFSDFWHLSKWPSFFSFLFFLLEILFGFNRSFSQRHQALRP